MNYGNLVGLPGSAIKCPFEVSGHEFKARPVSMAVDFSPGSSAALRGSARVLQVGMMEGKRVREKKVWEGGGRGHTGVEDNGKVIGSMDWRSQWSPRTAEVGNTLKCWGTV